MNPEWMEWAAENMPADMLKQMISSRNWDMEWRNNQIAELLAEHNKLHEALEEIRVLSTEQPDSHTHDMVVSVVDCALQEGRDD